MPTRTTRAAALAGAALAALLFAGCQAPAGPEMSASPSPTADATDAPIFESDEGALAAAVEAYERYVSVAAEIGSDGGNEPERIADVVDETVLDDALSDFEEMRERGIRTQGASSFDTVALVQHSEFDGSASVEIRLCRDANDSRILDDQGNDITPTDRPDRAPTQVVAVSSEATSAQLVIKDIETWPGDDFC